MNKLSKWQILKLIYLQWNVCYIHVRISWFMKFLLQGFENWKFSMFIMYDRFPNGNFDRYEFCLGTMNAALIYGSHKILVYVCYYIIYWVLGFQYDKWVLFFSQTYRHRYIFQSLVRLSYCVLSFLSADSN